MLFVFKYIKVGVLEVASTQTSLNSEFEIVLLLFFVASVVPVPSEYIPFVATPAVGDADVPVLGLLAFPSITQ